MKLITKMQSRDCGIKSNTLMKKRKKMKNKPPTHTHTHKKKRLKGVTGNSAPTPNSPSSPSPLQAEQPYGNLWEDTF